MARARKKGKLLVVWIIVALAVCVAAAWCLQAKKTVVLKPVVVDGPLSNPMTGFVPRADFYDIVGDNRLVYVDLTWGDLEPEEGRFDFTLFESENHLDEWRVKGKQVVFRFLCDVPEDDRHMDIPQWLYDATAGDGAWYDTEYGKGYSPNYENPTFIRLHRLAIQALGQRYGKDDFFCYIELGSLGHWGEWHTRHNSGIAPLPLEAVRDQYIQPYLKSFPHAMLLMRRPFRAAGQNQMGLYNDMAGEPADTAQWLQWISQGGEYSETEEKDALIPMPDAWKISPVGGELTSSIPMESLLQDKLEQTVSLIRQSHMTFLGPKSPVTPEDLMYPESVRSILSALGSRLRISRVELKQSLLLQDDLTVRLDWVNDGSAPFYRDWETVLLLLDDTGKEVLHCPVDIDIRSVVDSSPIPSTTILPTSQLPNGQYSLVLAILDPDTGFPAYNFAMEGMRQDHLCVLGTWKQE